MSMQPFTGRRISIRGTSGSGKSTLGRALSEILGIPYVELDSFYHMPGWTERPEPEFRQMVDEATQGDGWVVDGNYRMVKEITWAKADTVIWLDYPLHVIMRRLTIRTVGRCWRKELLWGTNYERMWRHILVPQDSIFWWTLKTYKKRRRDADELMRPDLYTDKTLLRFKDPADTDRWLASVRLSASNMAANDDSESPHADPRYS